MALVAAPRLVPFQPLLNRIPRSEPGNRPSSSTATCRRSRKPTKCLVTVGGDRIPPQTIPLKDGKILVKLAGLPCGDYSLNAVLRHRETRQTMLDVAYPDQHHRHPRLDRSRIKQLNNLVAEVLNQPVKNTPAPQTFTFVNPRDGWVFVAFTADAPAPDLTVKIDDRDTVITAATDRLEAFRELAMGEHRITVSGNTRRRAPARAFHPRDLRLSPVRELRRQGKRQLRLGLHEEAHPLRRDHAERRRSAGRRPRRGQGPGPEVAGQFQRRPRGRSRRCAGPHGETRRHDPAAVRRLHQRRTVLRPRHHRQLHQGPVAAAQSREPLDLHLDRRQAQHRLPAHRLHVRLPSTPPGVAAGCCSRPIAIRRPTKKRPPPTSTT